MLKVTNNYIFKGGKIKLTKEAATKDDRVQTYKNYPDIQPIKDVFFFGVVVV